jgi:hypothetical protein
MGIISGDNGYPARLPYFAEPVPPFIIRPEPKNEEGQNDWDKDEIFPLQIAHLD